MLERDCVCVYTRPGTASSCKHFERCDNSLDHSGPGGPMVHYRIRRRVSSDDIEANALAIFQACRGGCEGGGVSI